MRGQLSGACKTLSHQIGIILPMTLYRFTKQLSLAELLHIVPDVAWKGK